MSGVTGESAVLNRIIARVAQNERDIAVLKTQVARLTTQSAQADATAQLQLENNLSFTWTGATLALTWNAGYVKDKTGSPYPVPAGSQVLLATTVYWIAWNPPQQVMAFNTNLANLQSNPLNLIVCSVETGTGAAVPTVAGGGGSEPSGSSFTGRSYDAFP